MDMWRMVSSTNIRNSGFIKNLLPTVICLFLFIIILCPSAQARDRGRMQQGKTTNEIVSMMRERLGLSAEQVSQVRPIMEDEKNLRQQIMQKYGGQSRRYSDSPEMIELQAYTETRLSNVLSYEQMEGYRKLREEETQKSRERQRGRRGKRDGDDEMFKDVPGMPTF